MGAAPLVLSVVFTNKKRHVLLLQQLPRPQRQDQHTPTPKTTMNQHNSATSTEQYMHPLNDGSAPVAATKTPRQREGGSLLPIA